MKALAKVYPFLGNIRFLVALFVALGLAFVIHCKGNSFFQTAKNPLQFRCSNENQINFAAASVSYTLPILESLEYALFEFNGEKWSAVATKAKYVGDAIGNLLLKNRVEKLPVIAFVEDEHSQEYIAFISKSGEVEVSSLPWLIQKESLKGTKTSRKLEVKPPSKMGEGAFYFQLYTSKNP